MPSGGYIEWRGPGKNNARLVVSCGMKDGKQVKKTRNIGVVGKRKANEELAKFIAELANKEQEEKSPDITFGDLITRWRETDKYRKLRPKTSARYKQLLDRIQPHLKDKPLKTITEDDIINVLHMIEHGRKRSSETSATLHGQTLHHHFSLLRTLFRLAVSKKMISQSPVTADCRPVFEKTAIRYYDENQVFDLLQALKDAPLKYQVMIKLTLATGCRLGEIVGLSWGYVDFKAGTVGIYSTRTYVPGQGVVTGPPKSNASKRTCPVDQSIMQDLASYKELQQAQAARIGDKWTDSGYVFTNEFGKPLDPSSPSRWLHEFVKTHKLASLHFHGLRHTCATLLVQKGVGIADVAAMLGHSTPVITATTYVHSTMPGLKTASHIIGQVLSPQSPEGETSE